MVPGIRRTLNRLPLTLSENLIVLMDSFSEADGSKPVVWKLGS